MPTALRSSRNILVSTLCAAAALTITAATPVKPDLLAGLVWRNVGPFRGGRISAVSGAIGQPGVYYAGTPAGGVWKTTSAGETWYPVFDAIGEVAVSDRKKRWKSPRRIQTSCTRVPATK